MEVIPIPLCDQSSPAKGIRTRTFFIVDACLDEDALRNALDVLIRRHWRKLGGRIVARQGDRNQPEYHVPKQFEPDYALFSWSSSKPGHSIDKVAAAIRSPAQDEGPLLLPSMATVDSWFRPSEWPYHQQDALPEDPFLFVHLSLFTDATVITISIPHLVADQMGLRNIIKAWLGLIEGRDPPAMVGYDGDVLPGSGKAYTDYAKEEVVRKGRLRVRRTGEYFPFILLPLLLELLISFKEEHCVMFLPLSLVRSVRERCTKKIQEEYAEPARISDGDVISAILLKFCRMHKNKPQMLALSQAVNLRGVVPELGADTCDGFIHNAIHCSTARFRLERSTPLSDIAHANRKAIEEARSLRDAEIGMVVLREMARRGQSSHTCEPFERSYFVSNWCAAWSDLDFSPAVKKGEAVVGKPKLLVLGASGMRGAPKRFSSFIFSKTDEGYWTDIGVPVPAMKLIKEHLQWDPKLEHL